MIQSQGIINECTHISRSRALDIDNEILENVDASRLKIKIHTQIYTYIYYTWLYFRVAKILHDLITFDNTLNAFIITTIIGAYATVNNAMIQI